VSSAIHLRLDIPASSLPQEVKDTLLNTKDSRISNDGVFVLKAQNSRTQEQNREDAIVRLKAWIVSATKKQKPRKATRMSRAVKARRGEAKKQQSVRKSMRKKVDI
jgi:ribosome-associated protein